MFRKWVTRASLNMIESDGFHIKKKIEKEAFVFSLPRVVHPSVVFLYGACR